MPATHATATLQLPDAALVRRAAGGDNPAFEELYRRHSQAAFRVAQAVTHNPHDAADAVSEAFTKVFQALPTGRLADGGAQFRPYLMAATRNAAIDGLRRQGKATPSDSALILDAPETRSGGAERVVETLDASLVAQAFSTLPERWRTILWLTEVEGLAPREAAAVLDLTPNGAAQLAVRAREGLRERYLQVHLSTGVLARCTTTVGLLGAYVAGGLAARDVAKVDQHLVDCRECRDRVAELEDLETTLRRIAFPFPAVLAALAGSGAWAAKLGLAAAQGGVQATAGASGFQAGAAAGGTSVPTKVSRWSVDGSNETLRAMQRPLGVASMVLFSLGIIGAAIVSPESRLHTSQGERATPIAAPPSPAAIDDALVNDQAVTFSLATDVERREGGGAQVAGTPQPGGGASGDSASGPPAKPKPPPPAEPIANGDLRLGDGSQTAAAAAGVGPGSCTGLQVGATVVGCAPAPQKKGSQITISTRGQVPGDHSVSAP